MDGVVLLIDKPAGVTSHDVVARVRAAPAGVKVGHAGTLDPFATGPAARARRARDARPALPHGAAEDLRDGRAARAPLHAPATPRARSPRPGACPPDRSSLPTGEVRQRPPAYSAVKVGGERAYRRARRGEDVEVPERTVAVHRFERAAGARATARSYEIECSSGTYVRSLIADLGDAYCLELRRTAIGPFAVAGRRRGRRSSRSTTRSASCPSGRLDADDARARGPRPRRARGGADGVVRLTDADGLIALGRAAGRRRAQAHRRLPRREGHRASPTPSRARAASPSASSTASTSATARSSAGADTVLTFEPHPLAVIDPEAAPKLLTDLDDQGRPDRLARASEELVVIPFDERFAQQSAAGVHRRRARRARSAPRACRSARTSASATEAAGDPALLAADGRVRDPGRAARRGRGRDRLLDPHPRPGGRRRGRRRAARSSARPFQMRGERRRRRQARARARLPDGQPRARRRARVPRPRRLRLPGDRPGRGGRRPPRSTSACARPSRRAAACSSRPTCSTSTATSTASELRLDFLARLRGERRFPTRRGARRADAARRRGGPGASCVTVCYRVRAA